MKLDVKYDDTPGQIARQIFVIESRTIQEHALAQCPAEKKEKVRYHLNTFRERRKYCERFKVPFWL